MRYPIWGVTKDQNGRVILGATVAVYLTGTSTVASVYSAASGGAAVNSVTSSSDNGYFVFYVDTLDYTTQAFRLVISKSPYASITIDGVYSPMNFVDGFQMQVGVDALWDYGGGTAYTDATITAALTAIGTTNKKILLLREGTWVISQNVDWSAYANVTLQVAPGALISHGAYTISWGGAIDALPNQTIRVGTGAWTLSDKVPVVWVNWFGENTIQGTTDMTNAINTAVNSILSGEVLFLAQIYRVNTTIESSTVQHPVRLRGTGKILTTAGTRLKWMGGNSDSIIEINSFMQLYDMFIYNGNNATGLIGVDLLGDSGQSKTTTVLRGVSVKLCAVGFAFEWSWYNTLENCLSSYNDVGYDLKTHSNNINFYNCHSQNDGTAITNKNGTISYQVLWSGGSIEGATALGIEATQTSTDKWVFLNPYMERNYQHSIAGHISIIDPFINKDGGDSGERPVFDIAGSANVLIERPFLSTSVTQLFTISGSAAAYTVGGISVIAPFNRTDVATSIYATPAFLTDGYLHNSMFTTVESPWFDASGAISENIITTGEKWKLNGRYLVAAQVVVDTAVVVTGSDFTVTMGYGGSFNNIINTTFTTDRAVGVHNLPLVAAAPVVMYPGSYTYKVTGTAETSGKYKIVLFFID